MSQYRFALVGGGWRAEFFARVAQMIPDRFQLVGTWLRNPEKRLEWQKSFGGVMVDRIQDLVELKPDYIVMAIKKTESTPILMDLIELDVPILCETPPTVREDDFLPLWNKAQQYGTLIQVAEQYPYQPHYIAYKRIIESGILGEITDLNISTVHSYHAVAAARFLLNIGFETTELNGERFFFDVHHCADRYGLLTDGEVAPAKRDRVSFHFEGGKHVFFDFTWEQYHSPIRKRHILIRGTRGEIFDDRVCYLNENNLPVEEMIVRHDIGINNNQPLYIYGISLGKEYLYINPFPGIRLNDDEIAVAECMLRMGKLCQSGMGEVYSFENGMQDAYMAVEMEKVLTGEKTKEMTTKQPWNP